MEAQQVICKRSFTVVVTNKIQIVGKFDSEIGKETYMV